MDPSGDESPCLALPSGNYRWLSASGYRPPKRFLEVDDQLAANQAHRMANRGIGLLWRGDYHNARQLLAAMSRRVGRRTQKPSPPGQVAFHQWRQEQAQRARVLGMLLVPLEQDFTVPLRRAPDVRRACIEAYQQLDGPSLVALRELLGVLGAHQWRDKGIEVPALGTRIHPHYGVFAPTRGEYVDLVAETALPNRTLAYDVGTGTGVLAAVLARRGVRRVVATDIDTRAVICARDNIRRLALADRVHVEHADLFPPGPAPLVVCNPPWLPAQPTSVLDRAVYDPHSRMLRGFLAGLTNHLCTGGEGWLLLSDLAELLGLRARGELAALIDQSGLRVAGRTSTRPRHHRAGDTDDSLHAARAAEVITLWRLVAC
jgi:methylase of polypeptide subunit release factors